MNKMKLSLVMSLAFSRALRRQVGGRPGRKLGWSFRRSETVKIFQFKTEIVDGLNELKVEFEKEYPNIKLDIQTVGGGADYGRSENEICIQRCA